jgi:hypothetical protein
MDPVGTRVGGRVGRARAAVGGGSRIPGEEGASIVTHDGRSSIMLSDEARSHSSAARQRGPEGRSGDAVATQWATQAAGAQGDLAVGALRV